MATPITEAFVYCWTDRDTKKLYVGVHKSHVEDGYISSSKVLNKEYSDRPSSFTRQIIASGSFEDMRVFEAAILKAVDAAKSDHFYNQNNGDGTFFCLGHNDKTRRKMSETWKIKSEWNCSNKLAIAAWSGKKHDEKAKAKMSIAQKKHSDSRSAKMKSNNPMKDPVLIAKMLETRRKNKEAKNVNSNH